MFHVYIRDPNIECELITGHDSRQRVVYTRKRKKLCHVCVCIYVRLPPTWATYNPTKIKKLSLGEKHSFFHCRITLSRQKKKKRENTPGICVDKPLFCSFLNGIYLSMVGIQLKKTTKFKLLQGIVSPITHSVTINK